MKMMMSWNAQAQLLWEFCAIVIINAKHSIMHHLRWSLMSCDGLFCLSLKSLKNTFLSHKYFLSFRRYPVRFAEPLRSDFNYFANAFQIRVQLVTTSTADFCEYRIAFCVLTKTIKPEKTSCRDKNYWISICDTLYSKMMRYSTRAAIPISVCGWVCVFEYFIGICGAYEIIDCRKISILADKMKNSVALPEWFIGFAYVRVTSYAFQQQNAKTTARIDVWTLHLACHFQCHYHYEWMCHHIKQRSACKITVNFFIYFSHVRVCYHFITWYGRVVPITVWNGEINIRLCEQFYTFAYI